MERSDFLKTLGLGAGGLVLPPHLATHKSIKVYDNYIRGTQYYSYKTLKKVLKEGDSLQLVREHNNIYDVFAISVFFDELKLGYISAYENIVLANMLDAGVDLKVFVSKHNKNDSKFNAIAIEVYVQLITASDSLIKMQTNLRADDNIDKYRNSFNND